MQFIPYLDFDGQAREAFDFYAKAFQGKITARMTYGESPMAAQMPPETHGRVMHSKLETPGSGILMGADGPPHSASTKGCVNVTVDDPTEAERVFKGRCQSRSASSIAWARSSRPSARMNISAGQW